MNQKPYKPVLAVIGGRSANTDPRAIELARAVGRELARRDIAVICGGGDGIMEAVCEGVKSLGGVTFGVTKGNSHADVNQFVDYPIVTSMDLARNHIIVWTGQGVIAFDGMYGTLEEIALTLDIEKPLIVLGDRPLFDTAAVRLPFFRHIRGYDPQNVSDIIDEMMEMISEHGKQIKTEKYDAV